MFGYHHLKEHHQRKKEERRQEARDRLLEMTREAEKRAEAAEREARASERIRDAKSGAQHQTELCKATDESYLKGFAVGNQPVVPTNANCTAQVVNDGKIKELKINGTTLTVIKSDGTSVDFYVDDGSIFGGSQKRVIINAEDGSNNFGAIINLANKDLLRKAVYGEKISEIEIAKEMLTLPLGVEEDDMSIYRVFDLSNTGIIDSFNANQVSAFKKILKAIVEDLKSRVPGKRIELTPRFRFTKLSGFCDFVLESDMNCKSIGDEEDSNKIIVVGAKYVVTPQAIQYLYNGVKGATYDTTATIGNDLASKLFVVHPQQQFFMPNPLLNMQNMQQPVQPVQQPVMVQQQPVYETPFTVIRGH